MIRSKRGANGLRETAIEIGDISASTLSRIEQGKLPDIDSFLKICKWLNVTPDFFTTKDKNLDKEPNKLNEIISFFRADKTLHKDTAEALIKMIDLAYQTGVKQRIKTRNAR